MNINEYPKYDRDPDTGQDFMNREHIAWEKGYRAGKVIEKYPMSLQRAVEIYSQCQSRKGCSACPIHKFCGALHTVEQFARNLEIEKCI